MGAFYAELLTQFPLVSIEDPLSEDDWAGWVALTEQIGNKIQLVGDDLFRHQPGAPRGGHRQGRRERTPGEGQQIGTLTETLDAVDLAHRSGYKTMMSHRSGETEDTTIADLAVAVGSGQIKTGAPARSERVREVQPAAPHRGEPGRRRPLRRRAGVPALRLRGVSTPMSQRGRSRSGRPSREDAPSATVPGPGRALVGPAATGSHHYRDRTCRPRRVEPTRCGRRRGWTFARHRLPCPLQAGGRGTPVGAGAARAHLLRSVDGRAVILGVVICALALTLAMPFAHVSHAACGGRSARFRAGGARTATGPAAPTEGTDRGSRVDRHAGPRATRPGPPGETPYKCSCPGTGSRRRRTRPRRRRRPAPGTATCGSGSPNPRPSPRPKQRHAGGPRGAGTRPRRTRSTHGVSESSAQEDLDAVEASWSCPTGRPRDRVPQPGRPARRREDRPRLPTARPSRPSTT